MSKEMVKRELLIKNAEGKKMVKKSILDYCDQILKIIKKHPEIVDDIISSLEVSEVDFFNSINGEANNNLTYYDHVLSLSRELIKKKPSLK